MREIWIGIGTCAFTSAVVATPTAQVSLVPDSGSVPAGGSVSVAVVLNYATDGDLGGAFGAAGLYGFGGTVTATDAAVEGANAVINPGFALGVQATIPIDSLAQIGGGRGTSGPITDTAIELARFDVVLPPTASAGHFDIVYTGEVVLSLGDELVIFNSVPTPRRQFLVSFPTSIEVTSGCACDLDPNGTLNVDDVDAFATAFLAGDLAADLDASGSLNVDDIDAFASCFLSGCP